MTHPSQKNKNLLGWSIIGKVNDECQANDVMDQALASKLIAHIR